MDSSFWLKKWKDNEIGFHEGRPNPLLVKHFNKLSLEKGSSVFVPLCGKTLDITWLLSNGYEVLGAELSEKAINELFLQLGVVPSISEVGTLRRYSHDGLVIYVGDLFNLTRIDLGNVHAIYDRAALVALPAAMRRKYTKHLMEITLSAPQLLICYEYDQTTMQGPPFSIGADEVAEHYGHTYQVDLIESSLADGRIKEKSGAREIVWLLQPL